MTINETRTQRRNWRWVALTLLVTSAIVAACGGGTVVSPSPSGSDTITGSIEWQSCKDDPIVGNHPEIRCATIEVPLDYANPSGPTAEIALAILPAADQENRVGPLLLNFGGPGSSGIDILADNGRAIVPAEIGNRFDLVTWDPRGVQRSLPVECLTDEEMDVWISEPGSDNENPTQADWDAALEDAKWLADKCVAGSADVLPYIGTTASARDMESIRAAMGVEKLNYIGYSYGTSLGSVFATLYPDSVGNLILDGAIDPSPDDDSEYGEQGVSIQGALDRVMAWCDADSDCPFGNGETRQSMDALFEKID
ncbi:MAG: alpha/beta fold hydrolase, partial [Chloroflexota bacterium]